MKIKYSQTTNNIVNFSNSLLARFGVVPFHETIKRVDDVIKNADRIAVLLFDGLGTALIKKHLPKGAWLPRHHLHTITSTFPPTTVAATNGLLSGRYPIETGWLGWSQYFQEVAANVDLFSGKNNLTKEPLLDPNHIRELLDYPSILTLIKDKNPTYHVTSVWPSIVRPKGAKSLDEFFTMMSAQCAVAGPSFVYGYWVSPDLEIHDFGTNHPNVKKVIRAINDGVETLSKQHPTTLFLVLSDHGLIDVEFINEQENDKLFAMLERPFSNEPRSANFYVKKGKHKAFAKLFNKRYGRQFILKSRQQIIEEQWYGKGDPHPITDKFIGDFLAISVDKASFDHLKEGKLAHGDVKGHHAGLTEDEMNIDIMAINVKK
ncbi:MAG TPA: alkaline phosphatase family protein [Bacilli bacterium]|nr:alkaline phosphatase family protein [Bacilli bacterium]